MAQTMNKWIKEGRFTPDVTLMTYVKLLRKYKRHKHALESTKRSLHTTHSWDFMGLNIDETMEIPGYSTVNQENVIIGFIDTGIWPESPSFRDGGMPLVPPRWKGVCETGESFSNSSCNKKIIDYLNGYQVEEEANGIPVKYKSARDSAVHGTHTASTAAGRYVDNVNYNGLAAGEARGGVPMARIAVYKACWDSGCYCADLLAAFDDSIKDGVDIISVSLGPGLESSLNRTKAGGKVLVCRHSGSPEESRLAKNVEVQRVGGVGVVLIDETEEDVALPFTIPALSVGREAGDRILSYIKHTRLPRALILPAKAILGSRPAP